MCLVCTQSAGCHRGPPLLLEISVGFPRTATVSVVPLFFKFPTRGAHNRPKDILQQDEFLRANSPTFPCDRRENKLLQNVSIIRQFLRKIAAGRKGGSHTYSPYRDMSLAWENDAVVPNIVRAWPATLFGRHSSIRLQRKEELEMPLYNPSLRNILFGQLLFLHFLHTCDFFSDDT